MRARGSIVTQVEEWADLAMKCRDNGCRHLLVSSFVEASTIWRYVACVVIHDIEQTKSISVRPSIPKVGKQCTCKVRYLKVDSQFSYLTTNKLRTRVA